MNKKVMRAGFVGSGFAARFHFAALSKVSSVSVEPVGVYSSSAEHRNAFAAERGLYSYDSLDELLGNCDIVHVCVPPYAHEEVVVSALRRGLDVIVEKPFTGYFTDGTAQFDGRTFDGRTFDGRTFDGRTFDRSVALQAALESVERMLEAEKNSRGRIMYAENWVYAPSIQKESEVVRKSGAQILWMTGEQSHSGSHSDSYGKWRLSGGGSLIGKGSHPLGAVLYLKQVEGLSRDGLPIRPRSVSARTHSITRLDTFRDLGYIRTSYDDVEDFACVHIEFTDGTVADVFANELSLGGTNNRIEVRANNHRCICNMSHNNSMQTFTPDSRFLDDVYVVEKTETKAGWSEMSPDEGWFLGYQHEMEDFYKAAATLGPVQSGSTLAADTVRVIYSAYLSASRGGAEVTL